MDGKILTLFLLLLLISGVFAFTQPSFEGQPIIVSSGSDFYGSSEGIVTVDLNLDVVNTNFKDFFIRITGLDDTSTVVKEISFNKEKIETTSYPVYEISKTKISQKLLNKTPLDITLVFDPEEIGFSRKFNIELVDKDGFIIADLDPFLSGWDYRQKWTLNTDGIGLSSDVTNDHVILFKKDNTDSDFWGAVDSNGNDVRFTDESNNLLNYHFESWTDNTLMLAWVEVTDTFTSGADISGYLYYGNSGASWDQNEEGTYPSGYIGVWHFNETSGIQYDSTYNNNDISTISVTAQGSGTGKIGGCNDYERGSTDYVHIPDSALWTFGTSDDFTLYAWFKIEDDPNATMDIMRQYGGGQGINQLSIDSVTANKGAFFFRGTAENSTIVETTSDVSTSTDWQLLTGVRNTTDDKGYIYLDSVLENNGTDNSTSTIDIADTFNVGCAQDEASECFDGLIDEIRIFDYALSGDEIKLLYNSETLNLVTYSAQEEPVTITWNDFKIVENESKAEIDLNISTDLLFNFDVNLTLASFNVNDVNTFYQVRHENDDQNCFLWIRGAGTCGFYQDDLSYTTVSSSGDTYYIRSEAEDDHAFKSSAYNLDPDLYETRDGNTVLNSVNDWLGLYFTHARQNGTGDSNTFFNLSINSNFVGATNKNLHVYDCNYSGTTDPDADPFCNEFIIDSTTAKDKDGYYSVLFESDDQNSVNGVKLNQDGNHYVYMNCPTCSASQYWNISYLDNNSNIDMVRNFTSSTGFGDLTTYDKSIDGHFHFQNLLYDTNFEYYFTVTDNNVIYTSPIQKENIENVNLPPSINSYLYPLANTRYYGLVDINVSVSDPNNSALTCDLNINDGTTSYSVATDLNVVSNECGYTFNSGVYADGNYFVQILVKETGTTELYTTSGSADFNFFIDNNAPALVIVYPNGNEYFSNPSNITIDFNVSDAYPEVLIDLNYSSSNSQGTGTPVLLAESINGVNIVCSGIECAYTWDASAVADGNYYILINASDGLYASFDASDSDFNIYTPGSTPATNESDYTERYIAPGSNQRDVNRYYNPDSVFNLDEDEKQTAELKQMNTFLFYFGVIIIAIIIILGVVLWKKR